MRFAFVSIMNGASWAACEELWADAARQALASGHEVFVSVYEKAADAPQIKELQSLGATLNLRSANRWLRKSSLLTGINDTFGALERFNADAICVSQGGTYDIARSGNMDVLRGILKRRRAPFLMLCHCQQDAPPRARARRAREIFKNAAIVGMLSRNLHVLSESHLAAKLDNVRIFQNPLKHRDFTRLPWATTPRLKLAFVGRLEPVKGLDLLIDALGSRNWFERDWSLTVCGSGPDRSALEQRAESAGISKRVTFAGFVSDIAAMWRDHHALIMPSHAEGIPIALTEAMLCGRPVIATDVGGIRAALADGESGFIIERAKPLEIAAALERLWEQRDRLEAMGRRAYEITVATRDPNPGKTLVNWLRSMVPAARDVRYVAEAR